MEYDNARKNLKVRFSQSEIRIHEGISVNLEIIRKKNEISKLLRTKDADIIVRNRIVYYSPAMIRDCDQKLLLDMSTQILCYPRYYKRYAFE